MSVSLSSHHLHQLLLFSCGKYGLIINRCIKYLHAVTNPLQLHMQTRRAESWEGNGFRTPRRRENNWLIRCVSVSISLPLSPPKAEQSSHLKVRRSSCSEPEKHTLYAAGGGSQRWVRQLSVMVWDTCQSSAHAPDILRENVISGRMQNLEAQDSSPLLLFRLLVCNSLQLRSLISVSSEKYKEELRHKARYRSELLWWDTWSLLQTSWNQTKRRQADNSRSTSTAAGWQACYLVLFFFSPWLIGSMFCVLHGNRRGRKD